MQAPSAAFWAFFAAAYGRIRLWGPLGFSPVVFTLGAAVIRSRGQVAAVSPPAQESRTLRARDGTPGG